MKTFLFSLYTASLLAGVWMTFFGAMIGERSSEQNYGAGLMIAGAIFFASGSHGFGRMFKNDTSK